MSAITSVSDFSTDTNKAVTVRCNSPMGLAPLDNISLVFKILTVLVDQKLTTENTAALQERELPGPYQR